MPPTGGEVRGTAAAVYPGRRRCRRPQGLASKFVKSAIFLFILACSPPGTTDASPVEDSEEPAVQPSLPVETAIQEPLLGRPADEEQQQPQSTESIQSPTTERESFPRFTETMPEEVDTNKIDMGVDIEIDPNGQPSIDEELHQYFLQLRQEMQELSGANVELPVVEPESSPANDDIAETTTTEEEEADFVDDPVTRVIFSCNELHSERTAVLGTVILAGDVICAKERVIEVVDGGEARLLSDAPLLRIEGVRFVVGEDSAMYFGVNAMAVGALKGGSAQQIFTVLSGGHLAFHAEKQGPLPEGGHEEDSHSIVRVHEGGLFDVIGYAEYTASSVTVTSKKYSKNPEWMRVYRTRKKLERQHREQQQQQQQQQRPVTTVMPWVYRPFSSKESRTSTFTQRQQQSPERLEVGDELRYPASMTSLFGGSKLALGLDGSLLIAPGARVREIDAKVDEASYVTAEHVANGLGVFARKKLDGDLFSALLAKVDEDDTLKVKTLVAPRGDVSRALLQRKFSAMQGRDDKDSSGATNNTAAAAAAAIAAQESASARRIKALWEGLEQEKQRMLRLRGGGTPSGAEDGDASMPPPSQSPPREQKETVEDNTPPPLPPLSLELDDDVVLRVTDTGSVVVTVDGITAIDLGNPHVTKRKGGLSSRIKNFFGGLRRRRGTKKHDDSEADYKDSKDENKNKNTDGDTTKGVNDDGGAIVSEGYTLHAVENGFEVRLEGIFVWGRVLL